MKKFFAVVVALVAVVALVVAVGCTKTSDPVPTATPTIQVPTATATATATPITFSFATTSEGWYTPDPAYTTEEALSALVFDGANGHTANGSISVTGTYDATANTWTAVNHIAGSIEKDLGANTDLTGHTIKVWIKAPAEFAALADQYTAQIYVKNDNTCTPNWGYSSGGWTNLNSTAWTEMTFNVDSGVIANGNANKTCIRNIGVQVYRQTAGATNPAYDVPTCTILFDDITY